MQFTTNSKTFNNAISKVIQVIGKKATIPILDCLLLQVENGSLTLSATDLSVRIETTIEVESDDDFDFAINASLFSRIISELPDLQITLMFDSEKSESVLSASTGVYTIPTINSDEFPNRLELSDDAISCGLDAAVITRLDKLLSFAVSKDDLRATLQGINVVINSTGLTAVATDGHRLVKVKMPGITNAVEVSKILNPTLFILASNNCEKDDVVSLTIDDSSSEIIVGTTRITANNIDGPYPDIEKIIPTDTPNQIKFDLNEMRSSLRRVSIFSNVITHTITLNIKPDSIELTSSDKNEDDENEGRETINAELSGDPLQVSYNSEYLKQMLAHLNGGSATIRLKDGMSAGIIEPTEQADGEEVLMLQMPIKPS